MTRFCISKNLLGNGRANDLGFLCSLTNATYLITLQISTNNFGESYQIVLAISQLILPSWL